MLRLYPTEPLLAPSFINKPSMTNNNNNLYSVFYSFMSLAPEALINLSSPKQPPRADIHSERKLSPAAPPSHLSCHSNQPPPYPKNGIRNPKMMMRRREMNKVDVGRSLFIRKATNIGNERCKLLFRPQFILL